jgi:hypothetical protein
MFGAGVPLRVTWLLDGLDLNGTPDMLGREWFVTEEHGWSGSSPPRTNRTPRLWADGSSRGRPFRNERIIRLDGTVACPSWEARRLAEYTLSALCSGPDLYPLVCREETGPWLTWVELDDELAVSIVPGGYDLDFSIQLAAPDPFRYSLAESRAETTLPRRGGGGLTFDPPSLSGLDFTPAGASGLDFGEPDQSGAVVVDNQGNAPAPLIIELHGPLVPPVTVSRPDTGQRLIYQGAVFEGQTLVVDTGRRTAYLNDANYRHLLTVADWFRAPPGLSRVMWEHGGDYDERARMVVRWRHTRY